ncbi:TPA: hypothetical protein ACH3X2_011458 [Trebouxia sp. C0005]
MRLLCVLVVYIAVAAGFLHLVAAETSGHSNNWAVLVDTSRYWFNYRHIANTLSIYTTIKRLGIPDSNILLMLADDIACNPRNPHPTFVFNNADQQTNLYDDIVEVDYRGYEVTAGNFLDVLHGTHNPAVPKSKRLLSNNQSNLLVYITGHGGDGFMKFQDKEEVTSDGIGKAFALMHEQNKYNELLFIADTCQAASLYGSIRSPNIVSMASSKIGEDSLSHHVDYNVGVSVIDRFTYYMLDFFQGMGPDSTATMQNLIDHVRPKRLHSTFNFKAEAFGRPMSNVLLTDFFGDRKRVASRRQKAAHAQCTSRSGNTRAHNESNIEWQAPVQVATDADKAYSTPQQSSHHQEKLYVVEQPSMNEDLALLVLFSALSFVACSLMNRHL